MDQVDDNRRMSRVYFSFASSIHGGSDCEVSGMKLLNDETF